MAKVTGCTVVQKPGENAVELYVHGDTMPDSVYFELIKLLKEYRGKKQMVFIADNPRMLLLIRQSLPSEYIDKLELRRYADSLPAYMDAV